MNKPLCLIAWLWSALLLGWPGSGVDPSGSSASVLPIAVALPQAVISGEPWKPKAVPIDTARSVVRWKGTKFGGNGSHEGTLAVEDGYVDFMGDTVVGGLVLVDMNAIRITDIPPHETVPIRNLTNHIKAEFVTTRYPLSRFEIARIEYTSPTNGMVTGTLSIKGISQVMTLPVEIERVRDGSRCFRSRLELSRTAFQLGEDGSWFTQRLVDDLFIVELEIWIPNH